MLSGSDNVDSLMSPQQLLALLAVALLTTMGVRGQEEVVEDEAADTTTSIPTTSADGVKVDYSSLCLGKIGKLAHPSNCNKYILCLNDIATIKNCKKDRMFSEEKQHCDKSFKCNLTKSPGMPQSVPELAQVPPIPELASQVPELASKVPQLAAKVPQLPPILKLQPISPQSVQLAQSAVNIPLQRLSPVATQACPSYDGRWVAARNGQVPDGAVLGGNPLFFVGRAKYDKKHLVPCKVYVASKECFFAWGRKELSNFDYEVLTNVLHKWVPSNSNLPIPANAIPGGYVGATPRETLYIGRAATESIVHPGWVNGETRRFCHPYGGQSVCYDDYEVLVKFTPPEETAANV